MFSQTEATDGMRLMTSSSPQLSVHDHGMTARVHVGGVRIADVHKTGLTAYAASCLLSAARTKDLYFHKDFFTGQVQNRNTGSFVLCTQYDVRPAFYNLHRRHIGRHYLHGPFVAWFRICDVNTTSYVIECRVFDVRSGKLLVRERSLAIMVNLKTRKPQAFDITTAVYRTAKAYTTSISNYDVFQLSKRDFQVNCHDDVTARCYHHVTSKDIDVNGHMNIAVYFRCAESLLLQNNAVMHIGSLHPASFSAIFAHEARLGDKLCFEAHQLGNSTLIHIKRQDLVLSTLKFQYSYNHCLQSSL